MAGTRRRPPWAGNTQERMLRTWFGPGLPDGTLGQRKMTAYMSCVQGARKKQNRGVAWGARTRGASCGLCGPVASGVCAPRAHQAGNGRWLRLIRARKTARAPNPTLVGPPRPRGARNAQAPQAEHRAPFDSGSWPDMHPQLPSVRGSRFCEHQARPASWATSVPPSCSSKPKTPAVGTTMTAS
eukprot:5060680-Prymnesium_polylepis.1